MRFRYSFQKIVDLKSTEKTQAEWMLSTAVGKLHQEESFLSELQTEKMSVQQGLAQTSANPTPVSELILFQSYLEHIDHRITNKSEDVRVAQRNVVAGQEQLTAKMLEEKVWSKAREKAKMNFTAMVLKKEQEELDELATVRHKRLS